MGEHRDGSVALEKPVSCPARLAAEQNNAVSNAARLATGAVHAVSPGPQLGTAPANLVELR